VTNTIILNQIDCTLSWNLFKSYAISDVPLERMDIEDYGLPAVQWSIGKAWMRCKWTCSEKIDRISESWNLTAYLRMHSTRKTGRRRAFRIVGGEHLKTRLNVLEPGCAGTLGICLLVTLVNHTESLELRKSTGVFPTAHSKPFVTPWLGPSFLMTHDLLSIQLVRVSFQIPMK
jgi:hypothetical protein